MLDRRSEQSLENLGNAIDRLRDALAESPQNSLIVDGTIQRFEFVIELFWKTLQRLLEVEGIRTTTPREALRQAFHIGWISDDLPWIEMIRDRNETSHLYDEQMALRIYANVQMNFPELERTYRFLQDRYLP
jgi:nucleotidyltransferase substrate binding protein (TIGR01987 family)